MSKPTLCIECRHHVHISGACRKQGNLLGHWCCAPWPKIMNFVNGRLEPKHEVCSTHNDGSCIHFEPIWIIRFWNLFLNYNLFKET